MMQAIAKEVVWRQKNKTITKNADEIVRKREKGRKWLLSQEIKLPGLCVANKPEVIML